MKDTEAKKEKNHQCMNYGEATSAITIAVDIGHLFKKFYRGFDADILTWLPYDEDENNELVFPFKFQFKSGYSDETTTAIFNSLIKPCVLPAEFCHGCGKMSTGSFLLGNLPTYEFYNPSFVARQFGLGQLPPHLFFKGILRPREGISEVMEASSVFQLGSDLPSLYLHVWTRVNFSSNLFNSWWQEWRSHLFSGLVHPRCIALDGEFAFNRKVTYYFFLEKLFNEFSCQLF